MSRNTGGTGIAGRNTTEVDSPVAGIGQRGGAQPLGIERQGFAVARGN